MKQHLSPTTRKWETCSATKRQCRFEHREIETPAEDKAALWQTVQNSIQTALPTKFIIHNNQGRSWTKHVRQEGSSGKRCPECNEYLSQQDVDDLNSFQRGYAEVYCEECGAEIDWRRGGKNSPPYIVELNRDAAEILHNHAVARNTVWYHATTKENWDVKAAEKHVYIHAGTEKAARDRILIYFPNQEYYLYELRMKPDVPITEPGWDDNHFPQKRGDEKKIQTPVRSDKVTIYANDWEDPGSVSIISQLDNLQVVSKKKMAPIKPE